MFKVPFAIICDATCLHSKPLALCCFECRRLIGVIKEWIAFMDYMLYYARAHRSYDSSLSFVKTVSG